MPPETIVGRYRVVREVGRGGMGSVWLCVDERLGREVAVKQLGGLPGESSPHVARALREARSSAALHHPHVVAIFDAVEDGERVWLVMEHLSSRNLSQLIAEEGSLPPRRLAAIDAQVAEGLAAAHDRGTVHRDVKPGNILVAQDDLAKISDFGIARTIGDEQLTQTGMVMGTPLYFSPQLARGADPTPADDVWALGATLFSAVEGEPPWPHRSNAIAMLTHIASEPPPRPTRAGPLAGVIERMMDPDPAARPTMAAVAAELRAVADASAPDVAAPPHESTRAMPVPAPAPASAPTSAPVPGPRPARRRGRALPVAVALVTVLVVGAIVLLLGPLSGDDGGDDVAERADPSSTPQQTRAPDPDRSEPALDPSGTPPASQDVEPTDGGETTDGAEETDAPTDGATDFVADYYAALPSDTKTAWELLAPSYQAQTNYGRYQGFWRTVDSVAVDGVEPVGDDQVDVTLVYNGSEQETRRITVEPDGDGWLIVADEIVG
jgi:serine/threonine protein kinase